MICHELESGSDNLLQWLNAKQGTDDAVITGATVTATVQKKSDGTPIQVVTCAEIGSTGNYEGTFDDTNVTVVGERLDVVWDFDGGAGLKAAPIDDGIIVRKRTP